MEGHSRRERIRQKRGLAGHGGAGERCHSCCTEVGEGVLATTVHTSNNIVLFDLEGRSVGLIITRWLVSFHMMAYEHVA